MVRDKEERRGGWWSTGEGDKGGEGLDSQLDTESVQGSAETGKGRGTLVRDGGGTGL